MLLYINGRLSKIRSVSRAKTIQERFNSVKKVAKFEIAALFSRCVGEWKSAANSNLATFLTELSLSYIVLALVHYDPISAHFFLGDTAKNQALSGFFVYIYRFNQNKPSGV